MMKDRLEREGEKQNYSCVSDVDSLSILLMKQCE
jgi:hypothetical protein